MFKDLFQFFDDAWSQASSSNDWACAIAMCCHDDPPSICVVCLAEDADRDRVGVLARVGHTIVHERSQEISAVIHVSQWSISTACKW